VEVTVNEQENGMSFLLAPQAALKRKGHKQAVVAIISLLL